MIECQTGQLRALITPRINDALDCLLPFPEIFTNEAASYAISEISEHLVMTLVGGARVKRSNKGFDIVAGSQRIEVKARFVGKWREDAVHFNFGQHSKSAHLGYCLLWKAETNTRAALQFAIKAPMQFLADLRSDKTYYARPTVGQLRAASAARQVVGLL